MQDKLVLISDDSNFFEYIIPMLSLRKSDELYKYSFNDIPERLHLLTSSILIINSENHKEQTLQLLKLSESVPSIVFGYNDDDMDFKIEAYKAGMYDYFSMSTSKDELTARLMPALKSMSFINKQNLYRSILVKNKLISENNEVFLDSNNMLEQEFEKIHREAAYATLGAISPNEKSKFTLNPNQIETIILNNIRKNDLLINFAQNKYFLILYDIKLEKAKKLWNKISKNFSEPIFAGFVQIGDKSRQQAVNEVLNNLHQEINKSNEQFSGPNVFCGDNFVQNRNQFKKKIRQIISPVFYHIQQTYNDKLFGMRIIPECTQDYSILQILSGDTSGMMKISSPGLTKINIEISYRGVRKGQSLNPKRILLEPDELESGLLQDLAEQFIMEFKSEVDNGNS